MRTCNRLYIFSSSGCYDVWPCEWGALHALPAWSRVRSGILTAAGRSSPCPRALFLSGTLLQRPPASTCSHLLLLCTPLSPIQSSNRRSLTFQDAVRAVCVRCASVLSEEELATVGTLRLKLTACFVALVSSSGEWAVHGPDLLRVGYDRIPDVCSIVSIVSLGIDCPSRLGKGSVADSALGHPCCMSALRPSATSSTRAQSQSARRQLDSLTSSLLHPREYFVRPGHPLCASSRRAHPPLRPVLAVSSYTRPATAQYATPTTTPPPIDPTYYSTSQTDSMTADDDEPNSGYWARQSSDLAQEASDSSSSASVLVIIPDNVPSQQGGPPSSVDASIPFH